MDTCFVYPYSSWRRGDNGNRNGVVRRQLPKRCEIWMDMVRELREIVDETTTSRCACWTTAHPPRRSPTNR